MSAEYDGVYGRLLALVADPLACYREATPTLEPVGQSRREPDPLLAAVAQLRAEITAVLETRRRLDRQQQAEEVRTQVRTSASGPSGGTKVPTGPPRPGPLPPARLPEPSDAL